MQRAIALLGAGFLLCLWGCDSGGGMTGVQPSSPIITVPGLPSGGSNASAGTGPGAVTGGGTGGGTGSVPVAATTTGGTTSPATGSTTSGTVRPTATPTGVGVPGVPTAVECGGSGTMPLGPLRAVAGAGIIGSAVGTTSGGYTLLARAPVNGQPGALTVNPTTNRVYFWTVSDPNGAPGHWQVVDGNTYRVRTLLSFCSNENGGTAVDPSTNMIYFSESTHLENSSVLRLDGLTDTIIGRPVASGVSPDFVINPATHRLYALRLMEGEVVVNVTD